MYILCFFIFLSPLSLKITMKRREKKKDKRKGSWTHIETPATILSISSKKYLRNKSSDTNKVHQKWPEWVTLAVKDKWATCNLWVASGIHSGHYLWLFFILLNLFYWYFFNSTGDPIIKTSIHFHNLFSFYSLLFPCV